MAESDRLRTDHAIESQLQSLRNELLHWANGNLVVDSPLSTLEKAIKDMRSERIRKTGGWCSSESSPATPDQEGMTRAPARPYDDVPLPAGRMQPLLGPGKGQGPLVAGPSAVRLLLVEDDPFQADAIKALCEQCGYHAQVRRHRGRDVLCTRAPAPRTPTLMSPSRARSFPGGVVGDGGLAARTRPARHQPGALRCDDGGLLRLRPPLPHPSHPLPCLGECPRP